MHTCKIYMQTTEWQMSLICVHVDCTAINNQVNNIHSLPSGPCIQWGLCPRSRWGSLQHSPIPPSWAAGGHPSRTYPRRVFLNFIQILHLAVCTLPYIHVYYSGYATAWLSPLITCFAPPPNTQPGYGPAFNETLVNERQR